MYRYSKGQLILKCPFHVNIMVDTLPYEIKKANTWLLSDHAQYIKQDRPR